MTISKMYGTAVADHHLLLDGSHLPAADRIAARTGKNNGEIRPAPSLPKQN